MHELLKQLTADLPMKIIPIDGKPYLERYFVGFDEKGNQMWLHCILRSDSERWLHTHPFKCMSTIVHGWYREQHKTVEKVYEQGDVNRITENTLHRITEAMENTWSYLVVEPGRAETWKFIDANGSEKVMKSSGEDWYLKHKNREHEYAVFNSYKSMAYSLGLTYEEVVTLWETAEYKLNAKPLTASWDNLSTMYSDFIKSEFPENLIMCGPSRIGKADTRFSVSMHTKSGSEILREFIRENKKAVMDLMLTDLPKTNLCKSTLGVISTKAIVPQLTIKPVRKFKTVPFDRILIGQVFETVSGKAYAKISDWGYRAYSYEGGEKFGKVHFASKSGIIGLTYRVEV